MKTLTEARVETRTPAKKDRILLWLLLATTPAKDHDFDTPDHEPNNKEVHQKEYDHPVYEVVHDPGVQKKPDCQQGGNETEDILRSVEKVIQVIMAPFQPVFKEFCELYLYYTPTDYFCQAYYFAIILNLCKKLLKILLCDNI